MKCPFLINTKVEKFTNQQAYCVPVTHCKVVKTFADCIGEECPCFIKPNNGQAGMCGRAKKEE